MEMGMGIGTTEWQLRCKLDTWLLWKLLEEHHTVLHFHVTFIKYITGDRVVNPACRNLLLLFRGQPLTPLGAALDAGNNASLLLTRILNSVKRKSLILEGRPYKL